MHDSPHDPAYGTATQVEFAASNACARCGHSTLSQVDYCGRCGARLGPADPVSRGASPAASTAVRSSTGCPRCGVPRQPGDRYCTACGSDCWALAAATMSPAADGAARRAGHRAMFSAARAGLLVVGIVVVAVVASSGSPGGRGGGPPGLADVPSDAAAGEVLGARTPPSDPPVDAPGASESGRDAPSTPGSDGPPRAAPEATPRPTPAPTPWPRKASLEGEGSRVTEPFALAGGSFRVLSRVSTSNPDGCVYIGTFSARKAKSLPRDRSLRTTVVFLTGAASGKGWVDVDIPRGAYFMEIDSDCRWVIRITRH